MIPPGCTTGKAAIQAQLKLETGCAKQPLVVLGKEILIDALKFNEPADPHTHIVLNQKIAETLAVYQDHPLREMLYKLAGLAAEGRGSDEHSFGCAQAD